MSAAETTISYFTESIGVGGELVINPLSAHSQNPTGVWGLRLPTNFRHQLCFVVHCRAKLQRTLSFWSYKSITYTRFHGYEPYCSPVCQSIGTVVQSDRSTDPVGEAAQLPSHLSRRRHIPLPASLNNLSGAETPSVVLV